MRAPDNALYLGSNHIFSTAGLDDCDSSFEAMAMTLNTVLQILENQHNNIGKGPLANQKPAGAISHMMGLVLVKA